MRVKDEDTWDVGYWNDYINEFGIEAYIEARYLNEIERQEFRESLFDK